jgi:hypothetical protein
VVVQEDFIEELDEPGARGVGIVIVGEKVGRENIRGMLDELSFT